MRDRIVAGATTCTLPAVLVRQDNGRRVRPENDYPKARTVCRDAEARLGLTGTAGWIEPR
jgi:hypothetical protein